MNKDELMPSTAYSCPPEGDEEAVERVVEMGHPTLLGLTDTVFVSVAQLADALKELGWRTGKPELVIDGGRKQALLLLPRREGIRYSMLVVENHRQARVEVVRLEAVPTEHRHLKDLIHETAFE
jgi:hypothetical protein